MVVREVPDLVREFAAAAVSVSGAGYKTVGEVLRAGCPAVLVPYAGNGQTEQPRRARMLHERGLTRTLGHDEVSARGWARPSMLPRSGACSRAISTSTGPGIPLGCCSTRSVVRKAEKDS